MTLQAQLQQLSQQVNQQVCVYTDRGFDIKDVGSGMTHAYGEYCHHDRAQFPLYFDQERFAIVAYFCLMSSSAPKHGNRHSLLKSIKNKSVSEPSVTWSQLTSVIAWLLH